MAAKKLTLKGVVLPPERITDPLVVEIRQGEMGGNGLAVLAKPFRYHIGHKSSKEVVVIPEGFVTDFASIPTSLQWVVRPLGIHAKAAVLHDYLVVTNYASWRRCAEIFLEAMEVLEVPKVRRIAMFNAVLLHGKLKGHR